MLVCRDWQRAKDYGFEEDSYTSIHGGVEYYLQRFVKNDSYAIIDKDDNHFYITGDDDTNATDLDFLYDMIKDGVIEKVENDRLSIKT